MNNFRYLKGSCPVCGGARKDCRENLTNHMIHCRHDADPVGFVFRGHDAQGFGLWLPGEIADEQSEEKRKEWIEEQRREREAREAIERQRRAEGLDLVERDHQFRNLLGQLSLSPKHYEDLKRRGLTDEQINQGMFASVKKWQKLSSPVFHLLPGASIDGRSLNIGYSGYLCPIWHGDLIVGCQIRTEQSDGKYRWLTSVNKRRPNGQTSHLKNGELPISVVEADGDPDLRFCEGILKPYIASCHLGKSFIGAAGGNFTSSPQQIEEAITRIQPERLILCSDAGAVKNPHVMRSYQALYELVSSLGHELWVEWWGQFDKTEPDIDELSRGTHATIIRFEEFLKLSTSVVQQKSKRLISRTEWYNRFKRPREINSLTKFIQSQYDRAAYKYFRRTGSLPENAKPHPAIYKVEEESIERQRLADLAKNTTAIIKWEPPLKLIIAPITYIPGQLPSPEEWQQMGCPKIIFRKGDRLSLYKEARSKGYQFIQDSSGTGKGKSHDSGEISFESLGVEVDPKADKKPRIFRIDPNYRNPSTATVEDKYTPLVARHAGLDLDRDRLTPLSNPYQKRHQPTAENPAPDIAPPCPEHAAFRLMGERDKPVFGGQDSPLCQSCRHFSNCGFLKDRRETLSKAQYIATDINAMSSPAAQDIGIIEEAGVNVKATKKIEVSLSDISATAGRLHLESKDHQVYATLYPILKEIFFAVRDFDVENKRHGSAHAEVIKSLPSKNELENLILDQYWADWSNPQNDPWGNPEWGYKFSQYSDGNWIEESYLEGFNPTAPSLKDLAKECDRLLYLNVDKILSGIHTPEEKAQLIRDNILFNWISPLLRVLAGDRRYSVAIKPNRTLQIIKPFKRHQSVVKGFGFAVLLDATSTRDDLALNIGTSPDQLLEISQESPKDEFSNLTINCVRGIAGGRDRIISQKINGQYQKVESENSQETRLKYAIEKIVADHSGEKIGLIDHQQFIKNDSHSVIKHGLVEKFGYWFNESRGSNQFKELQHLIVVGRPTQNLGDLAAEWQSLSGQVKTPTDLSGRYGAWVRRKERSELNQAIGRLRANLRPREQLTAWMINDLNDEDIKAIKAKYPGVKINIIQAYDICPEAAPKGDRMARGIVEAVFEGVSTGIKVTSEAIANQLNTTQSNVSKTCKRLLGIGFMALKKILLSLFNSFNRKSHNLESLSDEEIWIAQAYLPMTWEQIQKANDPVIAAEELNLVAQSLGWQSLEAILGATDPSTLTGLLKSMIRCLPKEIHEQLNLSPG